MKLQPTITTASQCLTFGNKRIGTKLPKNLQAKPKYKIPKGLLISLIPLALSGFGTYYWQTHKTEAIKKSNEYIFKELLKQFGITIPDGNTNTIKTDTKIPDNTISMWKELSNNPIQAQDTISMQEALLKYGAGNNKNQVSIKNDEIQARSTISMNEAFLKYTAQPKCKTALHAED